MIPVAILVTMIVFSLLHLTPGAPARITAGEEPAPASMDAVRHELGLDQPLPVQYVAWISRAVTGDFGRSIRTHQPVLEAIGERVPATLELGLTAVALSVIVALVVGTLSAVRHNSALDLFATGLTLAGVSLANFLLGLILILVCGLVLGIAHPGGYVRFAEDPLDNLGRLVLPAITLATASIAVNMRQIRSSLLDVFGQDYIRTARSKGLSETRVIALHALKNGLIPAVPIIGLQIGAGVRGAGLTQPVLLWPPVGNLPY